MMSARYLIPVVALLSFLLLVISLILYTTGLLNYKLFYSLLLGIGIPLLNFLLGFLSIKLSFNQPHSLFLIIFFGGMLLRLMLMLISVFLVLKFLENIAYSFIFIIFIFYSFYLLTEILYLNQLKRK